jgi:hypothetical protein
VQVQVQVQVQVLGSLHRSRSLNSGTCCAVAMTVCSSHNATLYALGPTPALMPNFIVPRRANRGRAPRTRSPCAFLRDRCMDLLRTGVSCEVAAEWMCPYLAIDLITPH